MKKLLLGLGSIVAVAASIAAAVSCGDNLDKTVPLNALATTAASTKTLSFTV